MSELNLMQQLVADATISEYDGADTHADTHAESSRVLPLRALNILVMALCIFLLIFAGVRTQADSSSVTEERTALLQRVQARSGSIAAGEAGLASTQAAIDSLQAVQLSATSQGTALAQQIATLEVLAGATPVAGPGLVVSITDSPTSSNSFEPSIDRVLDQDLQAIVNGLWQAGATAIAVNDHRLTSASAIRSAGVAILVDFKPLNPPYVITAVGAARQSGQELANEFGKTPASELLKELRSTYRIESSVSSQERVAIAGAASIRGSR